jgi:hypothetical protein
MSIVGFVTSYWRIVRGNAVKRQLLRQPCGEHWEKESWARSLADPTAVYLECFRYFHQRLPEAVRAHRTYFHGVPGNRRGYGEDAFHVLWFLLLRAFKPADFLEIGVFRGQTLSLAALLARLGGWRCEVSGISPFTPAGDSVSRYREDVDYYEDTLRNFDHFELPRPRLLKALSTDPPALNHIQSRPWSAIYIDGNHDYAVASKDWAACAKAVQPGGVIVLDDAGLTTSFQPPVFATRGHPGPSRVAQEVDRAAFREILQVGHNRVFQRQPAG